MTIKQLIEQANTRFDAMEYMDRYLSTEAMEELVSNGMCFLTETQLNEHQVRALLPDFEPHCVEECYYKGTVIAHSYEEADALTKRRALNEDVVGKLTNNRFNFNINDN